ncbi:Alpha/Beta hydrolase protein [Baffinella frigidus]|nr:Alpha/Beta hydrolase protein [Cryptophyta sp. CCMP2293]
MSAAGGRQHLTPRAARQENARLQATENPDDGRESALRRLGSYHRNAYRSPWWARLCASGHVQTIIGSVFTVPLSPAYIRESWVAPDGHILAVDVLGTKETFSRGIVVLLHGLCGSSVNPLTCRQAHAFTDAGFDVAAVNFRGCAGEEEVGGHFYHVGYTSDLHWVIKKLHAQEPARRIYLSGMSLGGNVCTKTLGELGEGALDLNVCGGAVGCVPMNLFESAGILDRPGINQSIYTKKFVGDLTAKAAKLHHQFPSVREHFSLEELKQTKTLGEIESLVIAPLNGFQTGEDFYRQNCTRQFLSKIRVPHYIINARDDPFFCPYTLPTASDIGPGTVRIDYEARGGHCGFVESKSLAFFPINIHDTVVSAGFNGRASNGYLPEQLARMLEHLDATSGGHPTRAELDKAQRAAPPFAPPSVLGDAAWWNGHTADSPTVVKGSFQSSYRKLHPGRGTMSFGV